MKRFHLWIRELSLSQQLLSIVFLVVSSFTVFFFVFLSNNIDNFVENELFRLLHNSQINFSYYNGNDISSDSKHITNSNVSHIFYDKKSNDYIILSNEEINNDVLSVVISSVENYDGIKKDFTYTKKNSTILYSITDMDNNYILISLLSDNYRVEFRNALVNGVININILVVSILFIILTIWVGSLIHPLNLIKNYIDKIRNDEDAILKIDRKDEIGEVAYALVDMDNELKQQNQIREEMIQNISHDLKTPIATIKSYSESIKDGIYPYGTLEKSCDVIIEHANRLEKKVYSLIMLNKMGYLTDSEEGKTLEMKSLIEKVFISMKVIKPSINIITELEDIKFHGEEEPWKIVVENLVDNALRYAKSYIKITLKEGELCVINDGKNISEEKLTSIFKAYEKGSDGKFGLGLSIVYRVTSTYGYNVAAENLHEGVCFRIYNKADLKQEIKYDEIMEIEDK